MPWNEVFHVNDERKWEYFRLLGDRTAGCVRHAEEAKRKSSTLEDCISYALEAGDHMAFVHFFLNQTIDPREVYRRCRDKLFADHHCTNYSVSALVSKSWRDPDVQLVPEKTSSGTVLFEVKDGKKKKVSGKAGKNAYTEPRDRIVQWGVWLGLSVDELNLLLLSAGYPKLYDLDFWDAGVRIYLECFSELPEEKARNGPERLSYVKNELNRAYAEMTLSSAEGRPLLEAVEEDIIARKKHIETVSAGPGGESLPEDAPVDSLTRFLTYWAGRKIDAAERKDSLFETMKTVLADTREIYASKRWGENHKKLQYIDHSERYEKNTFYSNCALHEPRDLWQLREEIENGGSSRGHAVTRPRKNDSREEKIRQLTDIFYMPDVDDSEVKVRRPRGHYWLESFLKGRDDAGYKQDHLFKDIKQGLIRFAVAAGNESEIGAFLTLPGVAVWDRNWAENRDELLQMTQEQMEEAGLPLSRTDLMLVYALEYRDRMIRKYLGETPETAALAVQMKEQFPMIKLFQLISRDITFYLMKIHHRYDALDTEKKGAAEKRLGSANDEYNGSKTVRGRKSEMIFPVYFEMTDPKRWEPCEIPATVRWTGGLNAVSYAWRRRMERE